MKKRLFATLIIQLAILLIVPNSHAAASNKLEPADAPLLSASDVIAAINNYRVQNGLTALTANSLLNSLAQTQADYQASIEYVTHTGPNGSTPQERALAAGYGNGDGFYYSEIIYGGYNTSVNDAMTWWKNSSTHNYYILQATYAEIGAGVATNGNTTYYTAVLAGSYGDGSSSTGSESGSEGGSESTENNSEPTIPLNVVIPVQKATPNADGAIIHTVAEGQTLWTIAAVYEIELEILYELNGLNSYSYVFPGDQVVIQPPGTVPKPTQNSAALAANTPAGTRLSPNTGATSSRILGTPVAYNTTPQATNTPIVITLPVAANNDQPSADSMPAGGLIPQNQTVRTLLIIAFSILFVVVVGSMFIQKPQDEDEETT